MSPIPPVLDTSAAPEHALGADAVLARLETSAGGLTGRAAADRLAAHGPNKLAEAKPDPAWKRHVTASRAGESAEGAPA